MAKFPRLEIILAGFLAQISLRLMIYIENEDTPYPWYHMWDYSGPDVCGSDRIYWLALIVISVGVAVLTTWRNKEDKFTQGAITFAVSFLLNLSGGSFCLGYLAMECTAYKWDLHTVVIFENVYSGIALSITSIALIGISVHFWKKPATPTAARFPDPEVILLGVCAHFIVWNFLSIIGLKSELLLYSLCDNRGLGSWLHLLALSVTLGVVTHIKGTGNILVTFLSSFLLNLIVGGTGRLAIVCGIDASNMTYYGYGDEISSVTGRIYSSVTMIVNAVLFLGITVWFLRSTTVTEASTNPIDMEPEEENQKPENQMQPENTTQDATAV